MAFVMSWSKFVHVKKNILVLISFFCAFQLVGQVRFEQGEYVQFRTAKPGIHLLSGDEIIDRGILAAGDALDRLVIEARTESVLSHLNDTSRAFNAPINYYILDADGLLDAQSKVYFYMNGPFGIQWDAANERYEYTAHPYSNFEHFLVSAASTSQSYTMDERGSDLIGASTRVLNSSNQFYHRDTALYNLVGTGRRWFGELFDFTTTQVFDLPLTPLNASSMEVEIAAVARSSSSSTSLSVQNGGSVSFQAVATSSVSNYVIERGLTTNIPSSNKVILTYDKTSDNGAALWLDQLKVNYRTDNTVAQNAKYHKRFQNYPRHQDSISTIQLEGSGLLVFDITNQAQPVLINGTESGNMVSFEVGEDGFKELTAIPANGAFEPAYVRTGKLTFFEDLAGLDALIIAPDSLLTEAQRLAEIQLTVGTNSRAMALEEIYALANAGTPDIAAIRQFLVELNQRNNDGLKYLTLFGDASYDYKGTLPRNSNLVPTFESYGSFSLYTSYITDDYYGYLDQGESLNWYVDDIDLGIGRLPVNTLEEAAASVDKIERYLTDDGRYGPWRGDVVLVADDVDHAWEREFAVVQDALAKRLDTTRPEMNIIKIYSDAYLQESKPGSQRYPTAREALFRSVENGALMVSYIGHGGEVGWATERILQLEDINSWTNETKLPVFTTITCEFTRFDDPNRVSAGEQLFLNPYGGAIGLYSTTRSVFATNSTYDLNRLLNQNMVGLDVPRLGDVLRETKNNNISGDKIKFSLIGDPTIPLSKPKDAVVLDTINNVVWNAFEDTLTALSWVEIKGHVGSNSGINSDFNGRVWLTFFDKAQSVQTRRNDANGSAFNFKTQNNAIFRGEASVVNGSFTVQFRIPLDINLSIGTPKVISYAASSSEDAWGGQNDLLIGGVFDGIITDTEGPKVRLFINDTTFRSGGISGPNPLAIGLMEDESGINAVGLGIGHNVVLELDGQPINVNGAYQANIDDFTKGSVSYQYYDLTPGEHQLSLRAWDVLNQWGYDEITFTVIDAAEPILNQLEIFPNPFTSELNFNLEHNQKGQEGELRLTLMDNQGKIVWQWNENLTLQANTADLPTFYVSDVPSGKLVPGFYHARVVWTRSVDGKSARIQEKLIYIR